MAATSPTRRHWPSQSISQPPSALDFAVDRSFTGLTLAARRRAHPAGRLHPVRDRGPGDAGDRRVRRRLPVRHRVGRAAETFGILPEIWGTLYSSLLALLIGGFFGVTVAIFLTQDFLPPRLAVVFRTIDRHAGRDPQRRVRSVGHFRGHPGDPAGGRLAARISGLDSRCSAPRSSGPGLLPAALVLAIMILPTVAAISQDALRQVPYRTKEAAYGMGATRWEAILRVMLPTAAARHLRRPGAGLRPRARRDDGAGDAGRQRQPDQPVAVLAGQHAGLAAGLQFPRGRPRSSAQALMYAALVLLAITLLVNIAGQRASCAATRTSAGEAMSHGDKPPTLPAIDRHRDLQPLAGPSRAPCAARCSPPAPGRWR